MSNRIATSHTQSHFAWKNLHENVHITVADHRTLWNPMPPDPNTVLRDIASTTELVCSILAEASTKGASVRAVGGAWSLSDVAACKDVMLETRNLNLWFPIASGSLDGQCSLSADRLLYMQCGSSVGEVYRRLEGRGLTLPTSGASNGQTIAGAVSTGTHGSAFQYGALQECVVGIHLITGPDPSIDSIVLERSTEPICSHGLAQRLGARLVRNTELFDAALVSFGSMGFVMGYVVQADPLYHLESWRRVVPMNDAVRELMTTLNLDVIQSLVPAIPVHADRVWHVEVVLNPHDTANAYLTVMERWSTHRRLSPPEPHAVSTPGDDLLSLIGGLTSTLPSTAPAATTALLSATYGNRGPVVATPYGTFTAASVRGSALSVELGVPGNRSVDAVNAILNCKPAIDRYAGIIACRFVKASRATLAFTHFPVTCTIELPGVLSNNTTAFYDAVFQALFASNIPVTAHWGQVFPSGPDIVAAYGLNVRRWLDARNSLLSPSMQRVFHHPRIPTPAVAGYS